MGPEEKSDAEVNLTRVVSPQAAVGLIPERLAQVKPVTLFNQRVVLNPHLSFRKTGTSNAIKLIKGNLTLKIKQRGLPLW